MQVSDSTVDRLSAPVRTLGLVAVVALLAGCGATPDVAAPDVAAPTTTASSPAPTTTSAAAPAGGVPAFGKGTGRQTHRRTSGPLVVFNDIRVARHEGFDRVVLEFSGSGSPGWTAAYVDRAVVDGSGDVVAVQGDSTLDVRASNTTAPAPDYYAGPRRIRLERDDASVPEVYAVGTFEGYTQVLIGVDGSPAPYRVFALTGPSRLVIDVRHPDAD